MQNVHAHRPLAVHGPSHVSGHEAKFAHPRRNIAALGVQNGMFVADFGAGSGAYTLALAEHLQGSGRIYAIDVQRDLLRRIANEAARRRYKNVEVIWADLEVPRASKLAESSIDLVLVSNLLFQVPDKTTVLREARRIVKGTGHVALIDWSESLPAGRQVSARIGPQKEDVVKKETALELAEKNGLSLLREFPAGAHHYGLVLKPIASNI